MLLVLGRPGSGCSTFLKTLAGDTHGFHVAQETKINYEGTSYQQMHRDFKGECIYLAELDVSFPELTVGQTLAFASSSRGLNADNFDKVALLYQGRQIYFGPTNLAVEYFTRLEHVVREGFEYSAPKLPEEFANVWKHSAEAKALVQEIDSFNQTYPPHGNKTVEAEKLRLRTCTYTIPVWSQVQICVHRGFLRLRNNLDPVISGIVGNAVISIIVGSVFYNLGDTTQNVEQRAILLFFTLMINAFSPAFEYVEPVPHDWISLKDAGADYGPGVDRWIRWLNPIAYAYESLMINEVISGAFGIIHLVAAEYIPARRSRGEILLFQRGHYGKRHWDRDNEKGAPETFAQDVGSMVVKPNKDASKNQPPPRDQSVSVEIQNQSAIFHWNNLNYDIKTKDGTRRILDDINGWVKPGTLTALMGVTGAGKTSLLDVLAYRATEAASGEVYINGQLRDPSFQRRIGYVQQEDIHLPAATVREALEFSALLRQSNTESGNDRDKLAYVDTVLQMLEMETYADAVVGVPGEGLNVEQRKRLTIGVEMVAKPELLLFLGGTELYFGDIGPDASTLIDYFEGHGAPKCQPGDNPAEWILTVTKNTEHSNDGLDKSVRQSWAEKWSSSREKQLVLEHLEDLKRTLAKSSTSSPVPRGDEYAASFSKQLFVVTKRICQEYWRDPNYIYSKIALCIGIALGNGLSFLNATRDIQGLTNLLFSIFLITQLFGLIGQQVIPRLTEGRAVFEAREYRSKTFSWVIFIASNVAVEMFWQTVAAVLVFITWYYPTGLSRNGDISFGTPERGGLTFILVWLFCLWTSTLSQAVAAGMEHPDAAVQLSTLCYWLALLFCGILTSPGAFPHFWTFLYRVSPLTYLMNGIVFAGLANTYVTCSNIELIRISVPANSVARNCSEYLEPFSEASGGYSILGGTLAL
ncbi:hypothetical protein DL770_010332 [Monosporascus sp. CRB-9-2]|nr:hypothetical protein DL770_010332 [Monosporascus sp. CRB-9-2]